jgi:hypothetical protein
MKITVVVACDSKNQASPTAIATYMTMTSNRVRRRLLRSFSVLPLAMAAELTSFRRR